MILLALMCFSILVLDKSFYDIVGDRDMSHFVEDDREEGAMGYAGVNGLAAFEAQCSVFLAALYFFEKKVGIRLAYLALALVSIYCLMYSFSRGAYIALLLGWLYLGVVKKRTLVIFLFVFLISWQALVPPAVHERVVSTYSQNGSLEPSAAARVSLWDDAVHMFGENPVTGIGMNTYAYLGKGYANPHNYFLQVLLETGLVGMLLFLLLLWKIHQMGYRLFRLATDPFLASLGLGLAAWLVCALGANFFGDRWTYFQVNGYMWVLLGLVTRGLMIAQESQKVVTAETSDPAGPELLPDEAPQVC